MEGYSEKTIRRAKDHLDITSYLKYNDEGKRTWYWKLPKQKEDKNLFDFNVPKLPDMPKLPDSKNFWV